MEHFKFTIDNELSLLEKYKLTPTELFVIKVILLAQDGEYEYLQQFNEIFNIVIRFSQEEKWFKDSHKKSNYITIDEKGLEQVLRGEQPEIYKPKLGELMFRF